MRWRLRSSRNSKRLKTNSRRSSLALVRVACRMLTGTLKRTGFSLRCSRRLPISTTQWSRAGRTNSRSCRTGCKRPRTRRAARRKPQRHSLPSRTPKPQRWKPTASKLSLRLTWKPTSRLSALWNRRSTTRWRRPSRPLILPMHRASWPSGRRRSGWRAKRRNADASSRRPISRRGWLHARRRPRSTTKTRGRLSRINWSKKRTKRSPPLSKKPSLTLLPSKPRWTRSCRPWRMT